jgi:hypothetical protein
MPKAITHIDVAPGRAIKGRWAMSRVSTLRAVIDVPPTKRDRVLWSFTA